MTPEVGLNPYCRLFLLLLVCRERDGLGGVGFSGVVRRDGSGLELGNMGVVGVGSGGVGG